MQQQLKYIKRYFVITKVVYLLLIAGLFFLSNLSAQDKGIGQPMLLFQSDEVLYIDLQTDFREVFSVKDDSTNFPALISYTDSTGQKKTVDAKIRTRGKTRRNKNVCSFTPLRLIFSKKEVKDSPFKGQKNLKLVTHCKKPDYYEQNLMIEYLIYKAYNILTDTSFMVRPAIINYIYSEKKVDTVQKFAFFIEREKYLARRLQGIEIESEKIHPNKLDPYHTCLLDMFQYMIGNTDYSIYVLHNIILFSDSARKTTPAAVPYDFDWSGLVSSDYATPSPLVDAVDVSEHVYRGFIKPREIIDHTIQIFNSKKQEIYDLFENFDLLKNSRKKQAIRYLDQFYKIINNDKLVEREFIEQARVVHN